MATSTRTQVLRLGACLAAPLLAAAAGNLVTQRSVNDWYPTLDKPVWTPPGAVIGAVWSILYPLMGVSAWLTWREANRLPQLAGAPRGARNWFLGQLALNTAWSLAFFGLRSPLGGLVVMVPLWLSILGWVRAAGRVSPLAGWLQVPYLAWVTFAAGLNASLWWLNRATSGSGG